MRLKRAAVAGILWVGIAAMAAAEVSDDAAIRRAVEQKLQNANLANVDGAGARVEARDGMVTLSGSVKSLWAKNEAIEIAMDVDEVTAVEDELEIALGESDEAVGEAVAAQVRRYPHFTVYDDVNINVNEGHITLTGRVTMPFKSKEIGTRVSKVLGVQSLTNDIETLPVNIGDDRIRASLAYRIYSDSLFRDYAFRVNPPIHIIVERGSVALTGAVRSEVEKRKAEHIARSTFGVFRVENRLTVGD